MANVQKLYVYTMTNDSGFAPNPFYGVCTLACCKPRIRNSVGGRLYQKSQEEILRAGVWVAGVAGEDLNKRIKGIRGSLLYLMQVTEIRTFEAYWREYPQKQPRGEAYFANPYDNHGDSNSDFTFCGDNIYDVSQTEKSIRQLPSFHQTRDKFIATDAAHDISGEYVLLSRNFAYWGMDASEKWGEFLKGARGHSVYDPEELEQSIAKEKKQEEKRKLSEKLETAKSFLATAGKLIDSEAFVDAQLGRPINSAGGFDIEAARKAMDYA